MPKYLIEWLKCDCGDIYVLIIPERHLRSRLGRVTMASHELDYRMHKVDCMFQEVMNDARRANKGGEANHS